MDTFWQFYGYLAGTYLNYGVAGCVSLGIALGFWSAPLMIWSAFGAASLFLFGAPEWTLWVFGAVALVMNVKPIRRVLLSQFVMKIMKALGVIPKISETEKTALAAGVVWADKELFSGRPDFKRLMNEPYPDLTKEEKAFIEGPVEEICKSLDDWQIWKEKELSKESWEMIKRYRLLGMIIPREYGGLGFSALAHSEVIMKLASRSLPASVTVMVPNSLGPAELLIHYGTEAQKKYYLPRLATGEEIPCFALTEPNAGSDAGSIQASGVLFKGSDGKLQIRLNWNKRYITLAAISTTLGMAFKLKDPENLLGRGENLGITCALIPAKTSGVVIGRRHDPLGTPFYNCPTQGKDVVIPIDQVVGGAEGCGHGWKMLMECLAAGRGVSLPAQSVGGAKLTTRVISAYTAIRKQFGVNIGMFEGIEEPLSRIAGFTYLLEAMRRYTLGALDQGIKPPVVTAIAKYHSTELGRKIINDGMDIQGGAAISRGPRNLLAHQYIATPIGITVEGANIMTRTLIIFGQGAMRAHPYAFKEVSAMEAGDLKGFDDAFWGHVGHVFSNLARSIVLSWTRGYFAHTPYGGRAAQYYRKLSWVSASFAIMADIAMASLGGGLKTKEKLTGRFGDILSWMYIGTSILRRFRAEGSKKEDLPFLHFTMNYSLYQIQKAFDGIFANITVPGLTWFFRGPVRWWNNFNALAGEDNDKHTHKIADIVMNDAKQRDHLTEGIYLPKSFDQSLGRLDEAYRLVKKAEAAERKIRAAVKDKRLPKKKPAELLPEALKQQVITQEEYNVVMRSEDVRNQAIQVDDFSQEEYHSNKVSVTGIVSNGPGQSKTSKTA